MSKKSDLQGYTQCHFFAGIGGWSEALRVAGWPTGRPVWTGSCPCQPFSSAGKRKRTKDPRHLWPEFRRLIVECHPPIVFGEQVASKDGRLWLSGVRTDLEALGYAVGAADLCAAGVGAPHIRQRLYWVADTTGQQTYAANQERLYAKPGGSGGNGWVGDTESDAEREYRKPKTCVQTQIKARGSGLSFWGNAIWIQCQDGKARRIKPGICPLAHGIPGRVGLLRGYGNAIVPQVAAEFIMAYMDTFEKEGRRSPCTGQGKPALRHVSGQGARGTPPNKK